MDDRNWPSSRKRTPHRWDAASPKRRTACAHAVDGPGYRIEFAERQVGAGSGGNGPSRPGDRGGGLGQVSTRADARAACAGATSDATLAATGESEAASVDQDSPIIEWRCSEQFQNSELYPVSDYLERFLGAERDPSPTARFDRLAQRLDDYDLGTPESQFHYLQSCFCCHRTSGIRRATSALLVSVRRHFVRYVSGCSPALASGRFSSWSRTCIGLTRRAWSFFNSLSARVRTIEFLQSSHSVRNLRPRGQRWRIKRTWPSID